MLKMVNILEESKDIKIIRERDLSIIKTRQFFFAYIIFLEFCKKRGIYNYGTRINEVAFLESRVFNFFMDISDFIIKNKVKNVPFFIKYILSSNIYFKDWNKQSIYNKYLDELFFIESPEDGFFRSLNFVERWAEKTNNKMCEFFEKNTASYIIYNIDLRNLSPWFLLVSKKGRNFILNIIDNGMIGNLGKYFDEKKWEVKFRIRKSEVDFFRSILEREGI